VLDCSRIRRDLDWVAGRRIEATIADVWQSMDHHAPSERHALDSG
jgi:hypothetical protein